MFDLFINPVALKAFYFATLAKGFILHHNPRRRAAEEYRLAFYERAWREAADELGATVTPIDKHFFEITRDNVSVRVTDANCGIDSTVTLLILADKPLTYRILQAEGLPTPKFTTFSYNNIAPAVRFLDSAGRDCVVKPARGTGGGSGITTGISRHSHLAKAASAASLFCEDLLIEEQFEGDNYRLTYLDGELIDAFVRRLPFVVGDGQSSVGTLVRRANEERLAQRSGISQVLLTVDMDMKRTLAKQGLSFRSVPAAGKEITLKTVVNENRGSDNRTVTHSLCREIVEAGARACRATKVRLAGVDIITRDPKVSLEQSGGVMLEVNSPPNFYYHYHKADGAFPLAKHVLRRVFAERTGDVGVEGAIEPQAVEVGSAL